MTEEVIPTSDFLTGLRETVASGESVYGAVGSPRQVAKLAELDAKIALGRQLGEIQPAPEPWSVERAARARLATEFPLGDPAGQETSELLSAGLQSKFDRLSGLSTREQAGLAQQIADDFGYRASDASLRHSTYRPETSNYLTGNQIVEALWKEAEPAVAAIAKPGEQTKMMSLLRLDRNLLELMAVRGRNLTGYANRKSQLGLK
jgi:hypothetical protein